MLSRKTFLSWPVLRQLSGNDPLGRGPAVKSEPSETITSRTATADRVARSVCPYCAVGCGQRVFVKDEKVVQIEEGTQTAPSRAPPVPEGLGQQEPRDESAASRPKSATAGRMPPSGRISTSTAP